MDSEESSDDASFMYPKDVQAPHQELIQKIAHVNMGLKHSKKLVEGILPHFDAAKEPIDDRENDGFEYTAEPAFIQKNSS